MGGAVIPAVLDPWIRWLNAHSVDAERALGPWMGPLIGVIGRTAERRIRHASGEPVGWSGLTNRGPFHRLVPSEWLLADDMPDEFLRRASEGELLFVELERQRTVHAPWTVVLCDAGPDQLGAPRLVHLALLVVLATRHGAPRRLAVGVLQGDRLYEPALSQPAGQALGLARVRRAPTREDGLRWETILRRETAHPDVWLIGSSETRGIFGGPHHRVEVVERWRDGALDVEVQRRGVDVARAVLVAPPHGAGVVLADPFAARGAAVPSDARLSAAYAGSRWLLIRERRGANDRFVALASPDRRRAACKEVAGLERPGERLLAAGRYHKNPVTLWVNTDESRREFSIGLERRVHRMDVPAGFVVDPEAPLAPIFAHRRTVLVADASRMLWVLDLARGDGGPLGRQEGPLWFTPRGVLWCSSHGIERFTAESREWMTSAYVPCSAWCGNTGIAVERADRMRALRFVYEVSRWEPFEPALPEWLAHAAWFPRSERAVGLGGSELMLLVREQSGTRTIWRNVASTTLGPGPITWAGPDPGGHCYAVLTPGQVTFYSPNDGEILAIWEAR